MTKIITMFMQLSRDYMTIQISLLLLADSRWRYGRQALKFSTAVFCPYRVQQESSQLTTCKKELQVSLWAECQGQNKLM